MLKRQIIKIDEERCNGCGLCVLECAEGAIEIIDGKARLVSDKYCDGLGACIDHCPQDALIIEERGADEFDEEAVSVHLREIGREPIETAHHHTVACPSAQVLSFDRQARKGVQTADENAIVKSELSNWPVQLFLVPPRAPYFENADLVIAADCVPFAYANFHQDFLKNVEIWTHEIMTKCKSCGTSIYRDLNTGWCVRWCAYAKDCIGAEKYEQFVQAGGMSEESEEVQIPERLKKFMREQKMSIPGEE